MYKQPSNIVAARTQKALESSFLELLEDRDYEKVSISDICRQAQLARKSFYNHFPSKDDLFVQLMQGIFLEIEEGLDFDGLTNQDILRIIYEFVYDNKKQLVLFYKRGLLRFTHESIAGYLRKDQILLRIEASFLDDRAYKYIIAHISALLISMIETWIKNDFEEPVDFMVELTQCMLFRPSQV